MELLNSKVVVVAGCSSAVGLAMVGTFIEHGARVIGVAHDPPERSHFQKNGILSYLSSTGVFTAVYGDPSAEPTMDKVAHIASQMYGRADVLVNDVSCLVHSTSEGISEPEWVRVTTSITQLGRRLLPLMRPARHGRFVVISPDLSRDSALLSDPAFVSNHPLVRLTRAQAAEYGPGGITVNCIFPIGVAVESSLSDEHSRESTAKCPLGRFASPREIAAVALFLASPLSSYVTGTALVADGGRTVEA